MLRKAAVVGQSTVALAAAARGLWVAGPKGVRTFGASDADPRALTVANVALLLLAALEAL